MFFKVKRIGIILGVFLIICIVLAFICRHYSTEQTLQFAEETTPEVKEWSTFTYSGDMTKAGGYPTQIPVDFSLIYPSTDTIIGPSHCYSQFCGVVGYTFNIESPLLKGIDLVTHKKDALVSFVPISYDEDIRASFGDQPHIQIVGQKRSYGNSIGTEFLNVTPERSLTVNSSFLVTDFFTSETYDVFLFYAGPYTVVAARPADSSFSDQDWALFLSSLLVSTRYETSTWIEVTGALGTPGVYSDAFIVRVPPDMKVEVLYPGFPLGFADAFSIAATQATGPLPESLLVPIVDPRTANILPNEFVYQEGGRGDAVWKAGRYF
ncbi:MAG: hypothetical protein UW63_C0058G0008 [Candidatus Uhrbacteria bacterium GW2011_GWF2_44_350]|uniref:Uncharacterized protein n=1 Tax=Candidatus Uhrbacteria bacterium GW2011_GWF2_44_350 TaxID=1619000 RepID=A0A0G1JDK8_9BACT|nr:MAG: hypothetical protein UW63_C0058G0008 [Candidatus Uhrbacteria bacterium GW2011_GWF2_44_350]